tara:strand:+ start:10102 stop:10452 length:351 start_codon:yes stop_codon:yes gene_type:complete
MATLTSVSITESGTQLTLASAGAEGDKWENNGNEFLLVKNGSEGSVTITITTQVTSFESARYGDSTKSNTTLAIAAGQDGMIGPFAVGAYNDTDGNCNVTYSSSSSVRIGVFQIQK